MKNYFLFLITILLFQNLLSQTKLAKKLTEKEMFSYAEKVKKSTLLVVTDQDLIDESFSSEVREIIEKEFTEKWTFCKYKFVTAAEALEHVNELNYSFFILYSSKSSKNTTSSINYAIINGNRMAKDFSAYELYDDYFCSFELDFKDKSTGKRKKKKEILEVIDYRNYLPFIIGYFQTTLTNVYKKNRNFDVFGEQVKRKNMKKPYVFYYNDGRKILNGKTIYIDESILPDDFDEDDFFIKMNSVIEDGFYFKIVKNDEVKEVMFGENPDASFFGYYYYEAKADIGKMKYYSLTVYDINERKKLASFSNFHDHLLLQIASLTVSGAISAIVLIKFHNETNQARAGQ